MDLPLAIRLRVRPVIEGAVVLLVVIVAGGALLRLVWLDGVPLGLHFDEAVYGLLARDIFHGARPVFFSAYTGREPLYMYLMAGVFSLADSTALAIRLTSALIGLATIPLTYLLGRELFSHRVGLVGAALLAVSYWHLTVSRNGYPNVLIPPLEALSAFFLWRGYRENRTLSFAAGGLFAGLVLYTYLAARFWPVTLGALLAYALLVDRQRLRQRWGGLLLTGAVMVAVFAPLGLHFLRHPADFWERADQVLVFRQAGAGSLARLLLDNSRQTLGAFFLRGDPRWHYNLPGKPIFDPLLGTLFLAGLVIAIRHGRRLEYAALPMWVAVMGLPGILTADLQPAGQRMFGVFPALVLLPALGIDRAWAWLEGASALRACITSPLLPHGQESACEEDGYDPSAWQVGELVRGRYLLTVPADASPGWHRLRLRLSGEGRTLDLGQIEVAGPPRQFALPDVPHRHTAWLGDSIEFLGYDLPSTTFRAGEHVRLTLYWRAQTSVRGDYKVFTHLLDAEGRLRGQHDGVPVAGQRPTLGWLAGEIITDEYAIPIPPDAPPGRYLLQIGMYDPVTLVRLEARDAAGRRLPDDRVLLGEVEVMR